MRKYLIAIALLSVTASVGDARCKRLGKGRARHAVASAAAMPVKTVAAVGGCVSGTCKR